ncbi:MULTISPECIES: hypothetical protein [unclassified Acinetobacter]|uniref:hypothetical protein n=1 Tax=unclassified Acinetobacter TaxID=196816 RepID=UPI0035B92BF4
MTPKDAYADCNFKSIESLEESIQLKSDSAFSADFMGYERFSPPIFYVAISPYFQFSKVYHGEYAFSHHQRFLALRLCHINFKHKFNTYIFDFEKMKYCCVEQLQIWQLINFNYPYLTFGTSYDDDCEIFTRSIEYQTWYSFADFKNKEIGGVTDGYYFRHPEEKPKDYISHF